MFKSPESGNVFFYILIAIALFAALGFVVSNGNRGNTSSFTDQQARLAAQEIIEYGQTVANAVQKLRLRGFSDTEISFENNVYERMDGQLIHQASLYPNCTSDNCKIFRPEGGNISPVVFNENILVDMSDFSGTTFFSPGSLSFASIRAEGFGSNQQDLVLRIPGIKTEICIAINEILNVENPSGQPPPESIGGWREYNNDFTGTATIGNESSATQGKEAFCGVWYGASLGDDRESKFYQVLIAR